MKKAIFLVREALPFVERVMVEIPASKDVKNNTVNFARTVRATLGPVKALEASTAGGTELGRSLSAFNLKGKVAEYELVSVESRTCCYIRAKIGILRNGGLRPPKNPPKGGESL